MKVTITSDMSRKIDGYIMMPVIQSSVRIVDIPTNACEHIDIFNCLDEIKSETFLQDISNKLRKNGILSLVGVDSLAMCDSVVNEKVDKKDFVDYVKNKHYLWDIEEISSKLKIAGLQIISAKMNGMLYELKATR